MHKIRLLAKENTISKRMRELSEELNTVNTDNVIVFPVLTGGKTPPTGFWLMDLEIGTVFLARKIADKQNFVLTEFALYEKYQKCAVIVVAQESGAVPMPVDMRRFSNQFELVETIKVIPVEKIGRPVDEKKE